jgi:hypothetical protein
MEDISGSSEQIGKSQARRKLLTTRKIGPTLGD